MSTDILLLSYKFPPFEGVGARRWAKFSKYFVKKDFDVHVITTKWNSKGEKSWVNDVIGNEHIKITALRTPFHFLLSKSVFLNKVVTKIEYLLSNRLGWTDEAYAFYILNFKKIVSYILENDIKIVIATGGPFSSNYFAAKIKKEIPSVFLVQDFRDLWTEEYFFEYPTRNKNHPFYAKEKDMEKESFSAADLIVSVTPGCLSRIETKAINYGVKNKRYALVENGFDENDFAKFDPKDCPRDTFNEDVLNISHFGTLGFGREDEFLSFLKSVKQLILESGIRICFHFFGNSPEKFKMEIQGMGLEGIVKCYSHQPHASIQKYMYFSDLHLVVNDPVSYYAFGSKIYDAFLYKKPVILISKKEALSEIIKNNKIGLVTDTGLAENVTLIEILIKNNKLIKEKNYFNGSFNYDHYSIRTLTNKYMAAIEQFSSLSKQKNQ